MPATEYKLDGLTRLSDVELLAAIHDAVDTVDNDDLHDEIHEYLQEACERFAAQSYYDYFTTLFADADERKRELPAVIKSMGRRFKARLTASGEATGLTQRVGAVRAR